MKLPHIPKKQFSYFIKGNSMGLTHCLWMGTPVKFFNWTHESLRKTTEICVPLGAEHRKHQGELFQLSTFIANKCWKTTLVPWLKYIFFLFTVPEPFATKMGKVHWMYLQISPSNYILTKYIRLKWTIFKDNVSWVM